MSTETNYREAGMRPPRTTTDEPTTVEPADIQEPGTVEPTDPITTDPGQEA